MCVGSDRIHRGAFLLAVRQAMERNSATSMSSEFSVYFLLMGKKGRI